MKKFFTIAAGLIMATAGTAMYAGVTPTSTSGPNASGIITSTFGSEWDTTTDGSYPQVANDQLQAYVTDSNGLNIYIPFKNVGWTSEQNSPTVTFNLSDIITYNGTYTLTVPEGYIMVMESMDYDSDENSEYTYQFNWTKGVERPADAYIPSFVKSGNLVTITWRKGGTQAALSAGTTTGAKLENTSDNSTTNLEFNTNITIVGGNSLQVNIDPDGTLATGDYEIQIPENYVMFDSSSTGNDAINEGVSFIAFELGTTQFYGPTGIKKSQTGTTTFTNNYSTVKGTVTSEWSNIQGFSYNPTEENYITLNGVKVPEANVTVPGTPANILNINITGFEGAVNGNNLLLIPAGVLDLTDNNGVKGKNNELTYTFEGYDSTFKDPSYSVTFYVSGDVDDPADGVFAFNQTAEGALSLSQGENKETFTGKTVITFSSTDFDTYAIEMSVDGYDSPEEFGASGKGTLVNDEGTWTLTLNDESADGLEIYISVVEPSSANAKVTARFNVSGSGIDNPEEKVTISYFSIDPWGDFNVENGEASVNVGTTFTVTPVEGYIISDIISLASEETASISKPSNIFDEWQIAISWDATESDATFFITVAEAPANVSVNFTSSSNNIYGNPQDYVTVTSDDDVEFSDTENTLVIDESIEFEIAPVENFVISTVNVEYNGATVELSNLDTYGASISGNENGYTVSLTKESSGLVITFNIAGTGSDAINSINRIEDGAAIYNLQGVKVAKQNVTKGLYIIDGKKVLVK